MANHFRFFFFDLNLQFRYLVPIKFLLGIYGDSKASCLCYLALHALQHCDQEGSGIVTVNNNILQSITGVGLVFDVFNESKLDQLPGSLAIGHVRYSTVGQSMLKNVQPFVAGYHFGSVGVAHNGNLVNYRTLRAKLEEKEVHKFRDIGIELVSPDDDSAISASAGLTTVDLGHSSAEEIKPAASSSLEFQISSLNQQVNLLESKRKELQGVLVVKDSRIVELETSLSSGNFPKEVSANTVGLSEEKYREIESLKMRKERLDV